MKYPKNALTLHLYRYEEVVSSFTWSIINRKYTEAIFWGIELYNSGMMDDVFNRLTEAWAQYIGFAKHGYQILNDILRLEAEYQADNLDRDIFVLAIYSWCSVQMDSTVSQLLIRGSITATDWNITFPHSLEYRSINEAVISTLSRGKTMEAWILSRSLDSKDIWTIIEKLAAETPYKHSIYTKLAVLAIPEYTRLACCFVLLGLTDSFIDEFITDMKPKALPSEVSTLIQEWDTEESIRKLRAFPIRPEAITYTCDRSRIPISESTMADLQYEFEKNIQSSPCWQVILEPYMADTRWKSDILKEQFYDTYFPYKLGDIPDEWSLKDKELSHNRGLGKSDHIALRQHLINIFRNKSCIGAYSYNPSELPKKLPESLEWDSLYKSIRPPCAEHLKKLLPFKPKIKVFAIDT